VAVKCTRPPTVRFVQVRNEWVRDARLSLKAMGLLVYLHSHEDGYELSTAQIIRDHTDGKDAVRAGLAELEEFGYLTRVRERDGGRWGETDYVLADPFDTDGRIIRQSPAADRRIIHQSGFSAPEKPRREIRPIEDNRENTKAPSEPLSAGQLALVPPHDPFDDFWKVYPKKVGKKDAQRAWIKAIRSADPARIIEVASRYPWNPERRYIKDPATWLNKGCWEDDLDAVAGSLRGRETRDRLTGANYGPRYQNPDPSNPANAGAFEGGF